MPWILDDGPFGHLAAIVNPEQAANWRPGHLIVPGTTALAASRYDSAPGSALLSTRDADGAEIFEKASVLFGGTDPAADVLADLHSDPSSTIDLAEREAIAWALTHGEDAVFVTADKRAALTALAELGVGRVGHAFDVWLDLLGLGWLNASQFARLCGLTRKHDQGLDRLPGRIQNRLA